MSGEEGGGKNPKVKTRGTELPTDGPDHTTIGRRDIIVIKDRIPGQLVHSTGANMSVMV